MTKVAVIGAGTMGSGIAEVAALAGYEVALCDVGEPELARARAAIDASLARFVKAGRLTDDDAAAARQRIASTLEVEEAVQRVDFVVEAVPEVLDLKHTIVRRVAAHAPTSAVIGTNTSQFSITAIAAPVHADAGRVIGMHFFNPPVMMRLVELIRGEATADRTVELATEFATTLGKEVVLCRRDAPGFITSRAYAALRLECLRILEEGVASADDIDKALKLGFNLPMGPFELADFNGLDISLHVYSALQEAYGDRFRPTVSLRNMVAAGKLGQKTGEGFYRYDEGGNRIP